MHELLDYYVSEGQPSSSTRCTGCGRIRNWLIGFGWCPYAAADVAFIPAQAEDA